MLKQPEIDGGDPPRSAAPALPGRVLVLLGCGVFLGGALLFAITLLAKAQTGRVIYEATSAYSHIRVRETADELRTLFFVDADGRERPQSSIDLNAPHELRLAYTRSLFSTLLLRTKQDRILIVGLGGGGMVRFANHALPRTRVDAVEIDPVVVEVARRFFGTAPGPRTSIFTEDAFDFIAQPQGPYDVIYMDAFLRPPSGSDLEALPVRLRTSAFLEQLAGHLKPGGLVAFNLVQSDPAMAKDLAAITEVFPAVYQFSVAGTGNLVVIGSSTSTRHTRAEIEERAHKLEAGEIELPFVKMAGALLDRQP